MTYPTSRQRFVLDCRYVALVLGKTDEHAVESAAIGCHYEGIRKGARVYRDEVVEIIADPSGPSLAVEKLDNRNPVVSVGTDGKSIRDHGEQVYLHDHVQALAGKAAGLPYTEVHIMRIGS